MNELLFIETIIYIISITIMLVFFMYIWQKAQKTDKIVNYLIMHGATLAVLICDYLKLISPNSSIYRILIGLSFVVTCFFCISFFKFGYFFIKPIHLGVKANIMLYSIPVMGLIVAMTNPLHGLFLKESVFPIDYKTGILYRGIFFVAIILANLGAIFDIYSITKRTKKYFISFFSLIITIITFNFYYLYHSKIISMRLDITPILTVCIFSMLFYGTIKLGFFDTLSIGIIKSLELFNEALIVLDNSGKRFLCNTSFNKLEEELREKIIAFCIEEIPKIKDTKDVFKEVRLSLEENIFSISVSRSNTRKKDSSFVFIIHDDTDRINYINDLEEKNEQMKEMTDSIKDLEEDSKRLIVIEEKNLLSKEIHDVLGHSLNITLHTLESNKIILDKEPKKAVERIAKAIMDIETGINDISNGITEENRYSINTVNSLKTALNYMVERHFDLGVKIELNISRLSGLKNERVYKTIYRICQEAVTNSIKHGNSSQINISIKNKSKDTIEMHIVDNGVGCESFKKGNGITGMEERAKSINGNISFKSFDDTQGFLVYLTIPI